MTFQGRICLTPSVHPSRHVGLVNETRRGNTAIHAPTTASTIPTAKIAKNAPTFYADASGGHTGSATHAL